MRYAVWNNKGGVGKTFLSFVLGSELANSSEKPVILVDMCPQANLSEIVLGGNEKGAERLANLISKRKTVGGYFDARIESPHVTTGKESDFLLKADHYNHQLPDNLYLLAGDSSLELQAQVINQIGGQSLPVDAWKNVHNWLKDLIEACCEKLEDEEAFVFIDCNPSFSAYTELAMLAADRLIAPCSSDGSSARAIDNLGSLVYGIHSSNYGSAIFPEKARINKLALPKIHSILLNRSTLYSEEASEAFSAMYSEIKKRTKQIIKAKPDIEVDEGVDFGVIPDSHSVAIVCSHLGLPLHGIKPGKYKVHDVRPQVNSGPLERYKEAIEGIVSKLEEY